MLKEAIAVGLGAALGACLRYLIIMDAGIMGIEVHYLTTPINMIACFAMGLFAPGPLWGKGVLGGFSTLSAVAGAAVQQTAVGALLIVLTSFASCLISWFAGDALRSRIRRHA